MKKVNKSSWIFLIGAVLVLACVGLVMYNQQQSSKYDDIQAQLTAAKNKLSKINNDDLLAQKARLEQEIADTLAKQKELSSSLLATNDSISCTDTIINEAGKYGLYIISKTSTGVTPGVLKETACTAETVQLTVRGTMNSLASFITSFNKTFPTGIVETVEIVADQEKRKAPSTPEFVEENPEATSQATSEVDDAKDTTANISLVVYSYKGE